jgi:hypothetical protein
VWEVEMDYLCGRKLKKEISMLTAILDKEIKEPVVIDWTTPQESGITTLEEYRNEMYSAEHSGFISFEDHKKNMNQWLTEKLR